MKISNKMPNPMQNAETGKAAKSAQPDAVFDTKRGKGSVAGAGLGGSTRVDLSPRAQEMAKAKELARPNDSIDEAKVARLQKLIDDGKYKVDADAIADRLLDEHSKMPT